MGLDEFTVSNTQEKRTFSEEMERSARALNTANLAVYPVDARGLVANPDFSANSRANANPRRPAAGGQSKAMRSVQYREGVLQLERPEECHPRSHRRFQGDLCAGLLSGAQYLGREIP